MIVMFPSEVEQKIVALAAQRKVDPASLVASLVEKELNVELALAPVNGVGQDDDYDPEALNRAVAAIVNRTPEQRQAAQARAIRELKSQYELPPGFSAQDVMDSLEDDRADDEDPDSLNRAIAKMKSRTPEERVAMRERVLKGTPEPLPIPAGKTIFDMIPRLRGKETDQEVFDALERLS